MTIDPPDVANTLQLAHAASSQSGWKTANDDACAIHVPDGPSQLRTKGALLCIADGLGSATHGGDAARACISGLLSDYFSTPDSWTVRESLARVTAALNQWIYSQNLVAAQPGWLTTLSALVLRGRTGHLLHVGDCRIYQFRQGQLSCLTRCHRTRLTGHRHQLSACVGMQPHLHLDYQEFSLREGDVYLVISDGIHDFLDEGRVRNLLLDTPLAEIPETLIEVALENSSDDNLSCLAARVEHLPPDSMDDVRKALESLPFPPALAPGDRLDGFIILQELHASPRSELFLARDENTGQLLAIKVPSANFEGNSRYIEGFVREEWVGRRINHPGAMAIYPPSPDRSCLYHRMEYIQGISLREWMALNPAPAPDDIIPLLRQVVSVLRRLQRLSIIHQDLKPDNLMLDGEGRIKLIDYGAARVSGLVAKDSDTAVWPEGTANYVAPEYFLGDAPSNRSDIFSLGVILYEILSGRYPYPSVRGDRPPKLKSYRQLEYASLCAVRPDLPAWLDQVIQKACAPNPGDRYPALSELMADIESPPAADSAPTRTLAERNPTAFWQMVSAVLLVLHLLWLL
jgi:serine/threonine protein phosphatase PrpC